LGVFCCWGNSRYFIYLCKVLAIPKRTGSR